MSHIDTDRDKGRRITRATATLEGGRLHNRLRDCMQRVYASTPHCTMDRRPWLLQRPSLHRRRSVAEDISAASSPDRPSHPFLHCRRVERGALSQPQGSKGMHTQMPSIALGPEAWQDSRSLPRPDTYERKHTYGNLQRLLMTFTILPAFLP